MVKRKNNKAFNFTDAIFWNQLKVKSKLLREICHVFYATAGFILCVTSNTAKSVK